MSGQPSRGNWMSFCRPFDRFDFSRKRRVLIGIAAALSLCLTEYGMPTVHAEKPPAVPNADSFQYRWSPGQPQSYRFSCKAEVADWLLDVGGVNTYSSNAAAVARPCQRDWEVKQGSGTAFVVSPDGYLITCHHVIDNAANIKVTLGGRVMPCEVIASDSVNDLAILRVSQNNLSILPLADSEKVELAEEVRAAGFPLSDLLGSSLKITQGSLAGIATRQSSKVFQVDAVVNPGNSGGPLLDSRGAVIGVVNAQLVGFQISKVGFAVPVNYAKDLLRKHKIPFKATSNQTTLDGPTLAKRIAPATALVTMDGGRDGFSLGMASGQAGLRYHAVVERHKRTRADSDVSSPDQEDTSSRDDGRIVMDDHGEVKHFNGRMNLPCLLGPIGTMILDPLPKPHEGKTWNREDTVSMVVSGPDLEDPLCGLRPPGFPEREQWQPWHGPFGPSGPRVKHQAVSRKAAFSAEEPKNGFVTIRKQVAIKTVERLQTSSRMELTGAGETIFDLKAGVPQKVSFSGKFVWRQNGQTAEVPVTFECERINEDRVAKAAPNKKKPTPDADAGKGPTTSSDADRIESYLADLRAEERDWTRCFAALQGLAIMRPTVSRRDEVSEVLDAYLLEKSFSARASALRAVRVWGTNRNLPSLVQLLKTGQSASERARIMDALTALRSPEAAEVLAERLRTSGDRTAAAKALRTIGPVAEDAVLRLLSDPGADVRAEACKVLGDIGSQKSIDALKPLTANGDAATQRSARAALEKLRTRK